MSEWIGVDERLPERWDRVLVCNANEDNEHDDGVTEAIFAPCDKGCCEPKFESKGLEYISHNDVTHWMPLPKMPKTKHD